MKKIVLAAIAVVGFGVTGFAQQQVKFGPKAGVNFSNISGYDDAEMLTGFHVGAVAEIKFNEKFSIQPEVVYSAQGAKRERNTSFATFEGKQKLDYINVPIMAKYYIVNGFSVEAGPQVGFLVKAEEDVNGTINGVSIGDKTDNKDSFNSVDFGVNFGLAYDLPQGFFVNARYNLGLSDVIKDNADDAVKNNVIQVGVGYKFD